MIVGITGTSGSGKGTIVDYLVKKGFHHFSVSDFVAEEVRRRGLVVNRDSLVMVANDLREKNGSGYLVESLYTRAEQLGDNAVIESIRCVGEVEALRKKRSFVLLGVDADIELRYSRIVERTGPRDLVSFEKFVIDEQREMNSMNTNTQNISACLEMADYIFKNNWTVEELHGKIERVLNSFGNIVIEKSRLVEDSKKKVRPSWDEYFLEIVGVIKKRGTCDLGQEGCVIAKDRRVLATGYTGAPTGAPHCDEVGHIIKSFKDGNGWEYKYCSRTIHAEQNAICQAAKMGVSIGESTLYSETVPCEICAKMIVSSGIRRVVCLTGSKSDPTVEKLFMDAGVRLDVLNGGGE
ncbi:MAG: deaminase [archaeon]